MIFFTAIAIDAFRGFARRQDVPLDADAVIVTGANGLGKTSLVDAITWALTGDLAQMAKKQDRRRDEYVVSQYRAGDTATVELDVLVDDVPVRITRKGSSREGSNVSISWPDRQVVGAAADQALAELCRAGSPPDLQQAVDGWGVLRQDELRAVLSAPAEDFQARLRDILGLGILAEFEQYTKAAQKRSAQSTSEARKELADARAAASDAEARLSNARLRIERTPDTPPGPDLAKILRPLDETVRLVVEPPTSLGDLQALAEDASFSAGLLRGVSREFRAARSQLDAQPPPPDENQLAQRQARVDQAMRELSTARDALATASARLRQLRSEADSMARLAAAALPLIGTTCPVCGQPTDAEGVERRLREVVDAGGAGRSLLDAETEVADKTAEAHRCSAVVDEERAGAAQLAQRIDEHSRLVDELGAIQQRVEDLFTSRSFRFPLLSNEDGPSPEAFESTIVGLETVHSAVTRQARQLQQMASVERIPSLERSRDEANERSASLSRRVEALAKREADAKALADAAAQAGVDVTEEALQAIDPYFGEVFGRLAAHPTFSRLGLEHEVYYGKARTWARITDPVAGLDVSPRIVCSEGQLNVVALSFFVAFALTGGSRSLPFVVLDDPLQSLDDMNVLGFSDLCRHLRDSRQLIVTTHDRRFGGLLLRKLTPRRTEQTALRVHFEAWDRSGPAITTTRITPEEAPAVLVRLG